MMDDRQIIELYRQRDERAIQETREKYGRYCARIAGNLLQSEVDVEEVLADTWLGAWGAIPPHAPENLAAFLGKLTRRAAFKKYRGLSAEKRGGHAEDASFEELEDCIADGMSVDEAVETEFLTGLLNDFLGELPENMRKVFVRRYWYGDSVKEIAKDFAFTEGRVKSMLKRTRERLRKKLTEEGILI